MVHVQHGHGALTDDGVGLGWVATFGQWSLLGVYGSGMSEDQTPYERGVRAGAQQEQIDEHDRHFIRINGSLEKVASNLAVLSMGVQRIEDAMASNEKTVTATARALKEASDKAWTPWARFFAVIGAMSLTVNLYLLFVK